MNFNDGAIVMTAKRAGASPKGEIDLLTLVNQGHDRSMTNLMTTIKFRQFYHDSAAGPVHAPADSGAISVGTSNDWTEDPLTHNAYLTFQTSNGGDMAERLRITEEGDFKLNTDKVVFRAETGDAEIAGDVFVGGGPAPRHLTVASLDGDANIRVMAGGEGDATIVMTSPYVNGSVSTFQIKNEGAPDDHIPVLRFASLNADGASDNLMSLKDLGTTGELHVSGNVMIGNDDSPGTHRLVVQSGATAELLVQSGENAEATVTITSGIDQNARLVLVDPALNGEGSTFEIFNDGAENELPALRIADGDSNVMLSVVDMGETGDLHVTGDGIIGSANAQGPRTLTVQSNNTAEIDIIAGGSSDAILTITSGRDRQASLVLIDPANETEGSEFHIINDGLEDENGQVPEFPVLRITDGEYTLMTLTDKDDTGDLAVTGSGLFGGPNEIGERTLSVFSGEEAKVEVVAGGESDARVVITSGADMDAKLIFTDPAELSGNTFEIFNDGSEAAPTLRITDGVDEDGNDGNTMLKIIDRGATGDLVVSGNGLFGGPDAVGTRTLMVQSSLAAEIRVISGASNDASVMVQSGPDMDAKLVLVDPAAGLAGSRFEILNRGSAAQPTLEITDGENTMLTVTDSGSTGNLAVTGSGLFGGSDINEDRTLSIQSGMEAKLEVIAGEGYDATVTVTAGVDKNARIVLSDSSSSAGSHFEIVNEGAENEWPKLSITDGTNTMLSITDRGTSGDLLVTGDGLIGGPNSVGPRTLTVLSSEQASVQVLSGENSDAVVTIAAGVDKNAKLVLQDADTVDSNGVVTASGARFELLNDGSTEFPTFKITDGSNVMMSVIDRGPVGDLFVSGSATFGGPDAVGDREVLVQSTGEASVNVVSGPGNDAVVTITAGTHQDAKLILEDPADGALSSVFEIYNDGDAAVGHEPTLRITDGSSMHADGVTVVPGNTMLALIDKGTTALLQVSGDGVFGSSTDMGDRTLTVQSGGAASVSVVSGGDNDAEVTITAGHNRDAKVRFVDPAAGTAGAVFELVNSGSRNLPTLEIRDGTNTLVTITDNGNTGDMEVTGTVECENFQARGRVELGNDLADEVVINGHIQQSDLVFDANSDGNKLTLHFEDPSVSQEIVFPDETGTVLTNTSSFSTLTAVGALSSGSIVPGFGTIVTTNNIETVGAGTITSGGMFTAMGDFVANGDVYLGDEETDEIIIRGTVVSDITFAPNRGLAFENAAKDKSTTLTARFNPTTTDSPAGERAITIPDVPSGGTLHVVTKGAGKVSNVGVITMHVTAGLIESYSVSLNAMAEEQLSLNNELIQPTSVVVATIADFGSGGTVFVFAVKVADAGGSCAFIIRNIHNSAQMTSTYKVGFAIFN